MMKKAQVPHRWKTFSAFFLALLFSSLNAHAITVSDGSVSTITNVNAGLCLGVAEASTGSGALLQSQSCDASNFQQWKMIKDPAGYFEIVNVGSGKCIDVSNGSTSNGTNMQQWGCSGADYQKWNISDQGNGQFAIISKYNGLALEVYEFSLSDGARVVQWDWHGGANQKWTLPSATYGNSGAGPASGSIITLEGVQAGKCIGVEGSADASGASLQSQECSGSAFQQWKAVRGSAGYYELINVGSGKCMDLPGASAAGATVIQQWGCSGGGWQKWKFNDDGAGHFYITSKSSGLALDVLNASTADGAAIIQWDYWGGANQQWVARASSGGPIGFGAGVTGGEGGAVVTVTTPSQLEAALCGSESNGVCTDATPRIIRVSGIIDFRNTEGETTALGCTYSHNSCSYKGKSERILDWSSYCAGKPKYNITFDTAGKTPVLVGSNKTLIGVGAHSGIQGKGLIVKGGVSNVVIRNLSITDINEGIIWAGDGITLDNASKVWIDHNYFARIGRQMIVTGWGTAKEVTISDNFFDGTTDYGHYCNGKHYWMLLFLAENQTITLAGNRIHNASGRSPKVGKQATAASGGTVHIVNNYYDGSYYMGFEASDDVVTLVEGNYFSKGDYFFPVSATSTDKLFAPDDANIATANTRCQSVLGRNCAANHAANSSGNFILNPSVMPAIEASSSATRAIGSVRPSPYFSVPSHGVGPQANITYQP